MRRFIAHIGAAKTGTTAFQTWLKAQRNEMLACGFLSPKKSSRLGNHRNLVMSLAGMSDLPNGPAVLATTLREFADHRDRDILVSAEVMSSPDHAPRLLPSLSAALMEFERVAILSVRDQVAHYNSGFAQRRKAMRRNERDFASFLREGTDKGRGDWRALVQLYEAQGWRVVAIPYGAEAKARGVTRTILSLPEFGDIAERLPVDEPIAGNPSMGAIGMIITDLIQDAVDPMGARDTQAPAELRKRVARVANARFGDRPFNGFTEEDRAVLIARFAEGNRWIAERFFDVPWEVACPPQPRAPVSPRTLADLPDHMAKQVARTARRMTEVAIDLGGLDRRAKVRSED